MQRPFQLIKLIFQTKFGDVSFLNRSGSVISLVSRMTPPLPSQTLEPPCTKLQLFGLNCSGTAPYKLNAFKTRHIEYMF